MKNGNGASHSGSDKDGDRIYVDFGEAGKLRTLAQQQALERFRAGYGLWEKEFIATVDEPIETKKTLLFAACVNQFQHATEAWGDPIEVIDWAHDWADYLAIDTDEQQRLIADAKKKAGAATEMDRHERRRAVSSKGSRHLAVIKAVEVRPEIVEWLWPGRLARGKHTCIAGEPGTGKSQLTIAIIAAVTTGGLWPCGEGRAPIGNVIVLSAEDGAADTIVPRLMAAGADRKRVHLVSAVCNPDGSRRAINLQHDLDLLEREIADFGDVVLVVVDPVSSYLGKTDSHKNSEVRGVLEPLSEMADRLRVAILSVTHFSKAGTNTSKKTLDRFIGSIAFTGAPRAAFAVIEDAETEGRMLFLHAKNNLAAKPQGLAFRLEQCLVAEGIVASRVVWCGEPVAITANEAMAAEGTGAETQTAKTEAIEFLQAELATGPRFKKEIDKAADEAGISDRTLKRAKRDLGIVAERTGGLGSEGKWVWRLPSHGDQNPSKRANNAYQGHVLDVASLGNSGPLSANGQGHPSRSNDFQ